MPRFGRRTPSQRPQNDSMSTASPTACIMRCLDCYGIDATMPTPEGGSLRSSNSACPLLRDCWDCTAVEEPAQRRRSFDASSLVSSASSIISVDDEPITPRSSPKSASRGRRLLSKASCGLLRLARSSSETLPGATADTEQLISPTSSNMQRTASLHESPTKRFGFGSLKRANTPTDPSHPRKSRSLSSLIGLTRRHTHQSPIQSEPTTNLPDTDHYRWSRLRETVFLYDPALFQSSRRDLFDARNSESSADIELHYHQYVPSPLELAMSSEF